MSLQIRLLQAKQCVQRGHLNDALQIYRGLLRLMPQHPTVNSLLASVLIEIGQPEQAVKPLEIASAQEPDNTEHWVRLLAAYHRSGLVHQARQLLDKGADLGVQERIIEELRQSLSNPPQTQVQALHTLIESGNRVSAEIAARMMVTDYPDSAIVRDGLQRVLAMEVANAS